MAGHSAFKNIMHRKGAQDAKRARKAAQAHIKSLRQKLRAVGVPEDLIETVHGLGYRLRQV